MVRAYKTVMHPRGTLTVDRRVANAGLHASGRKKVAVATTIRRDRSIVSQAV